MHDLIDQLAFSLLKKNNLQDCTVDELKSVIQNHPGYAVGQLLYTAKLKNSGAADYQKELQRLSLYFNNPLWLNFLLTQKEPEKIITPEKSEPVKASFEDFTNDELVVENPRPEIFKAEVLQTHTEPIPSIVEAIAEPAFVFEPFHTVDYFASQGIKNVIDEKPKDRFGQQLKSFTEWLKALKTQPGEQNGLKEEKISEEKVTVLADSSIADRNVITEAMAEVWEKQGNPEKAIDIYNKLSLLNPSKSSYFATLIEHLKKK